MTILMCAARDGRTDVLHLLLAHGASLNDYDENGWTALVWALSGGYVDTASFLIAQNADLPNFEIITSPFILSVNASCLLDVATFLKTSSKNDEPLLSEVYKQVSVYFTNLINKILGQDCPWPWVTDDMRARLLDDIQELGIGNSRPVPK